MFRLYYLHLSYALLLGTLTGCMTCDGRPGSSATCYRTRDSCPDVAEVAALAVPKAKEVIACHDRPESTPASPEGVVERVSYETDLVALAHSAEQLLDVATESDAQDNPIAVVHYELEVADCQCLAAYRSVLANVLESERRLTVSAMAREHHPKKKRAFRIASNLLALRIFEERNLAAELALTAFYGLAEADSSLHSIGAALEQLDRTIQHHDDLTRQALEVPLDKELLQRQQFQLSAQQAELQAGIEQLNDQLRILVAIDAAYFQPIMSEDQSTLHQSVDEESAVQHGLAVRPDLNMIRLLICELDSSTLPVIRSALKVFDPGLGIASDGICGTLKSMLCPATDNEEVRVRHWQLCQFLRLRSQKAEAEIRQAARDANFHAYDVLIAQRNRDSFAESLERLRDRREASNDVTVFDINAAELELIQAQQELNGKVIAWKLADVVLRKSQGILAEECGCGTYLTCCF